MGRGRHTRPDKSSNRVKTMKEGRELQGAPSLRNKQEMVQVRAREEQLGQQGENQIQPDI